MQADWRSDAVRATPGVDRLCRDVLLRSLSPGMKQAIDRALDAADALGQRAVKEAILAAAKRAAGGGRTLTVLAVEAYLGCDDEGRVPDADVL